MSKLGPINHFLSPMSCDSLMLQGYLHFTAGYILYNCVWRKKKSWFLKISGVNGEQAEAILGWVDIRG